MKFFRGEVPRRCDNVGREYDAGIQRFRTYGKNLTGRDIGRYLPAINKEPSPPQGAGSVKPSFSGRQIVISIPAITSCGVSQLALVRI